ncbi:hypothetical protein [Psittacicella gerlachiana]|uniref:Uncharacterized protein n=1 Tax=Psittacicella gerlachiana TaxID=2028574 RepID=A0A3A1YBR0_9GAMM|nr:hypothetical protein [Psittacicella gerlachiana]RIY34639.1 hypothetical protein CKF59_05195 [Psittacicella gerlachiana]
MKKKRLQWWKFIALIPFLWIAKISNADTITYFVKNIQQKFFISTEKPRSSQVIPWYFATAQGIDIWCAERRTQVTPASFAQAKRITLVYDGFGQNLPKGSSVVNPNSNNLEQANFRKNNFAWQLTNAVVYVTNDQDQEKLYKGCKVNFTKALKVTVISQQREVKLKEIKEINHIPHAFLKQLDSLSFARCTSLLSGETEARLYITYDGTEYKPLGLVFNHGEVEQYCQIK